MDVLDRLRVVLLRPRNPENLGAVARAMKNFELSTWSLVDPRTLDFAAARRVAVHSAEILDRPVLAASLSEAVGASTWVVGTSSRQVPGLPVFTPRAFADEALRRAAAGQEVSLVFGDERQGMTNADLLPCHALARIGTGAAQPSLNLAQAFAVFAHALHEAAQITRPPSARPGVSQAQLEELEAAIGQALSSGGFLRPSAPRDALRSLLRTLQRAQLSPREWRLWMAVAGKLAKRASAPRRPT